MTFWLIVTSPANFKRDREFLGFRIQGLPFRYRRSVQKMQLGDKVVYYIMSLQKFGATASITGEYFEEHKKLWTDDDEVWPARRASESEIILRDDELKIHAKKLVPNLSRIQKKEVWGVYLQGSIREIPEEDFRLIESEMKKVVAERKQTIEPSKQPTQAKRKTEKQYETLIQELPLETSTLYDRLGRNA